MGFSGVSIESLGICLIHAQESLNLANISNSGFPIISRLLLKQVLNTLRPIHVELSF